VKIGLYQYTCYKTERRYIKSAIKSIY